MPAANRIQFFFSIIPDSKRQQTTTVDNKRLINGLVLTDGFPLQQIHKATKMDELQQGAFGPIFTQFKGKPKEAIRFLRQQQKGECIASLHRDDIGDIDIVWGEVTDPVKHKGFGLSHIIDKHEAEIKQLGFEVEDFVPIVVQFGELKEKKSDQVSQYLAFVWTVHGQICFVPQNYISFVNRQDCTRC